jgi:hypothetical protein
MPAQQVDVVEYQGRQTRQIAISAVLKEEAGD